MDYSLHQRIVNNVEVIKYRLHHGILNSFHDGRFGIVYLIMLAGAHFGVGHRSPD